MRHGTIARGPFRAAGLAIVLVIAGGCAADETPAPPLRQFGYEPYYVDEATELLIGGLPGIASWHRDVLLACDVDPVAVKKGDGAARFDTCEVKLLRDGDVHATELSKLRAALRLAGDRLLLQRPNLDVVVRSPSGEEVQIASAALAPTVAPDGERVAFIQLPEGTTEPAPGLSRSLVLVDIVTGERRTITEDPSAYAPHIIPGTSDVLFVSARTSLASLWIAPEGKPEYQLTNVGMTRMGKGFVPVPLAQLVWLPGTRRAVFTAHYDEDKLWMIDVDSGAAEVLGPSRWPNIARDGIVLGYDPGPFGDVPQEPAVRRYLEAP